MFINRAIISPNFPFSLEKKTQKSIVIKNLISRKRFRIFEEEEFFFDRFRKKNMYLKQLCYCKYLKKEENADMLKNSCD